MKNCLLQNSIVSYSQSSIYFNRSNQIVRSMMLMLHSHVSFGQNNTFIQSSINLQYLHCIFKTVTCLAAILLSLQVELYFFNHLNYTSYQIQIQYSSITLLHTEELYRLIQIPIYILKHRQMYHSLITHHSLLEEPYMLKHQAVIHVFIIFTRHALKASIFILKEIMLEMQAVCCMEAILIPVRYIPLSAKLLIIQHMCLTPLLKLATVRDRSWDLPVTS